MTIADLTAWQPIIGVAATCTAALVALGGVIWANRRADARERERHRREQLVAAIGELLGVAEEAMRTAVLLHDAALDYQHATGKSALHTGRIAAEVEPVFNDFTALTIKASAARFRIELFEPRLQVPANKVVARCVQMGEAASHNRSQGVLTLRDTQLAEVRELIEAYRHLQRD
ncbi:hypothetical protein [Mycobacterium sp. pW045]|uniref:hypothetical protein n=1 Tax=Mycobacterium sp. pW045 TaxID=3238984 RepID=UPI00351B83D2